LGYLGLPWATLGYLGIILLCARTFQGLHFVRLWTPTIFVNQKSYLGLQYAYLDSSSSDPKKNESSNDVSADLSKSSRPEITLDELDDLYRSEEAEKEAEIATKRLLLTSSTNFLNHTTNIKVNSSTPPPVLRMRSRDDLRSNNKAKKINRLSRKQNYMHN
jgi:hypothetical protein